MRKYILPVLLIAGASFFSMKGMAQDSASQQETIILKKEGTFPDNLTIHIEGDKVTINGKTPDDISITRKQSSGERMMLFKQFHGNGLPDNFSPPSFDNRQQKSRAFLGVLTQRNDSSSGARIAEIEAGTPADSAGLQKEDVIIKINDQDISSATELSKTIRACEPGSKVTVTYLRDGEKQQKEIQLGRLDNVHTRFFSPKPFETYLPPNGLNQWFRKNHPRIDMNPNLKMFHSRGPKLGVVAENNDQPEGVRVVHVSPNTPADKADIKEEDIITAFGGETIANIDELKEAINNNKGKDNIEVKAERNEKQITLHVSLLKPKKRASL